jgi:hypothetical protein
MRWSRVGELGTHNRNAMTQTRAAQSLNKWSEMMRI